MIRIPGTIVAALATCCVLAGGMFALLPSVAQADEQWGVLGAFGHAPADSEPLSGPTWMAVDNSIGDLYVVDAANDRVEYFTTTGSYLGQFNGAASPTGVFKEPEGIAVDNDPNSPSFKDVYVIDKGHEVVDKFNATGTYIGQLTGECPFEGCPASEIVPFKVLFGVAVDSKGALWVENGEEHHVSPTIDTFTNEQLNVFLSGRVFRDGTANKSGLAVDTEDNIYLISREARVVDKFNSIGEELVEGLDNEIGDVSDIAIDPTTNNLYINAGSSVAILNSASSLIQSFGAGVLNTGAGIAIDPAAGAGYAYVSEPAENEVLLFEYNSMPQAPPLVPSTDKAVEVTGISAKLKGKLKLAAGETKLGYFFEYNAGASCAGGSRTPLKFEEGEGEVSEVVTGLEPRVGYTFCFVAVKFGATAGSQQSVTTSAAAPVVISESASTLHHVSEALFQAVIDPNHSEQETKYSFEYSTKGSVSGNELTGTVDTVEGEGAILAEEFGPREIKSMEVILQGSETYYYRAVATNGIGSTTVGKVQAFTRAPIISAENASQITLTGATIEAEINPYFQVTTYGIEYATSETTLKEGKGTLVAGGSTLGEEEEFENKPVAIVLNGLKPNTAYYYRVVAENPSTKKISVPAYGETKKFTTHSLPFVNTGEAASVTRTSATLAGTIDTVGLAGTYYFRYISETAYQAALAKGIADPYTEGESTVPLSIAASEAIQTVGPVPVSGLLSGTTYHYRLVARNEFGAEYGAEYTFRTSAKLLPQVNTGGASGVGQNSATLSGTVDTNGLQTQYGFEIATEPGQYGPATGLGSVGGAQTETVSVALNELQPGTTYYYRITASNDDGTSYGEVATFTTPGFPVLLTPQTSLPEIPVPSIAFPTISQENPGTTKAKTLTKAQKLKNALKACKKDKSKHKRASCEKQAHKKYGAMTKRKGK